MRTYISYYFGLVQIIFRIGSNEVDGPNRYRRPLGGGADETFQFQIGQFRNGGLFVEATTQGEGHDILTL